MVPTEELIGSIEAANLFRMTRAGFYRFAQKWGILNAIPHNPAKTRQEHAYHFEDIARVYKEVYGKELTFADIERLRREAQGAP